DGTSQAAPHVTGIVALMLQKFRELTGLGLDVKTLRNSTSKALLIHTATDMIDTVGDSIQGNPDIDSTEADGKSHYVRYYAGPDFATGWGKVNGKKALDYVDTNFFREETVAYSEDLEWTIHVPSTQQHLRATIAWDDAPVYLTDYESSYLDSKLVNDIDLALISPSGELYYPWRLDPLPVGASTGSGTSWRSSGIEPIQETDIVPAHRSCSSSDTLDISCFDHRNNVEVVDVDSPEDGDWKILVRGYRVVQGNSTDSSSQWVSIVCDDTLGAPKRGNSHPYAANQDTKFTYSLGNSLVSQVTFSDSTYLGTGDTIKIYDGSGKLVGVYTGDELQGKTLEIVGSTVTVELISDGGENDSYGFSISSITGVPFSILPLMWEATKKVK
ncbi:MAG TPA: S8 family serine peptidase, partial [Fibrobacteraceae bacterium]|nr:S8 family serine peptidase [Fibrobacteraceae bacterium]